MNDEMQRRRFLQLLAIQAGGLALPSWGFAGDDDPYAPRHVTYASMSTLSQDDLKRACEQDSFPENVRLDYIIPPNDQDLGGRLLYRSGPVHKELVVELRRPVPQGQTLVNTADLQEDKRFEFSQSRSAEGTTIKSLYLDQGIRQYRHEDAYHADRDRPPSPLDLVGLVLDDERKNEFFYHDDKRIYVRMDEQDLRDADGRKVRRNKVLTATFGADEDLDKEVKGQKLKQVRLFSYVHKGKRLPYQIDLLYQVNWFLFTPDITIRGVLDHAKLG